jgi:hypothetical protein
MWHAEKGWAFDRYQGLIDRWETDLNKLLTDKTRYELAKLQAEVGRLDNTEPVFAIINSKEEELVIRSFKKWQESSFGESIEVMESDVVSRVIILVLSDHEWIGTDRFHPEHEWRAPSSRDVTESLGSVYQIDPFIFQEMMSTKELEFWCMRKSKTTKLTMGTEPDFP